MMVMTAKVNMKKVALILGIAVAVIIGLILVFGGNGQAETTAATPITNNEQRVKFLENFGWDVASSPAESGQVRIPEQMSEVFDRYNNLQKQQGYDLNTYAGKNVMRYVYKVENFPDATDPVYATVLVYKNQVIGGDITNTAAGGTVQGFKKKSDTPATKPSESAANSAPASS